MPAEPSYALHVQPLARSAPAGREAGVRAARPSRLRPERSVLLNEELSPAEPRSPHPIALALQLALLGAPAAVFAWLAWRRRWVAEDAFIDLRVVEHLLAGDGPVFNMGERVEAYTSPLWIALLSAFAWIGQGRLSLEWLVVWLGLGCASGGLLAASLAAWQRARAGGHRALALPAGVLVALAPAAAWDFATSGLESGLALAWIGSAYLALIRCWASAARRAWPAAVLIGLGPLVRPDLGVVALAFLLALGLAAPRPPGHWLRLALAAGPLPAAYQLFRMGYFAAVVPNTALAKEAGLARWDQGWRYLADFTGTYWLWVPGAALLWWLGFELFLPGPGGPCLDDQAARERRRATMALVVLPVAAGLLHGVYVVRLGGDFMHGRMLLPSLFTALLPVAVAAGARWWHGALPLVVVLPWAVACVLWLRPPYHGIGNGVGPEGIADERWFYVWLSGRAHPITLADYAAAPWKQDGDQLRLLAERERVLLPWRAPEPPEMVDPIPPGWPAALPLAPAVPANVVANRKNIGLTGYAAGRHVHVVDRLGLADPLAARLQLAERGRPGHEKDLPDAWVVARFAAPEALTPALLETASEVRAARAALGCGDLALLLQAIQAPLTPPRFVQNVRLAWRLTTFRLPAGPVAAEAALCASPASVPSP